MLIWCIKILIIFKRQQFKDNKRDETKSSILKYQQLYIYINKNGQNFDIYESEHKTEIYVLLAFIAYLVLF